MPESFKNLASFRTKNSSISTLPRQKRKKNNLKEIFHEASKTRISILPEPTLDDKGEENGNSHSVPSRKGLSSDQKKKEERKKKKKRREREERGNVKAAKQNGKGE